ncbi:MAG: DUF134 domain-containing protein [Paludibacter sp.]|nr:DUF134 domain-containing protein [Paludibacter sp.]
MARPKQDRKICNPPLMQGFKPFGIPRNLLSSVSLQIDEYEAIRLLDYEGMNQDQAAGQMNVSRPTLTRIYEKGRKTIAQALVEGKMITIEGGNVRFDRQWFRCKRCFKLIDGLENHVRCKDCKNFGNDELSAINEKSEKELSLDKGQK